MAPNCFLTVYNNKKLSKPITNAYQRNGHLNLLVPSSALLSLWLLLAAGLLGSHSMPEKHMRNVNIPSQYGNIW